MRHTQWTMKHAFYVCGITKEGDTDKNDKLHSINSECNLTNKWENWTGLKEGIEGVIIYKKVEKEGRERHLKL